VTGTHSEYTSTGTVFAGTVSSMDRTETALPTISGPTSLRPIPATRHTFSETPRSSRETVAEDNLAQLDDCPPLGSGLGRPINRTYSETVVGVVFAVPQPVSQHA